MTGGTTLRLVLDQGVPRDAAVRLRDLGYQCQHVGELGMERAADDQILAWAADTNAIVLTLDADFHTILAVSGANGPSVIRVRMQGLSAQKLVNLVPDILTGFEVDLKHGALVTVKPRKTTCHRLPIGSSE